MKSTYTARFRKAYKGLNKSTKELVKKAIRLMDENIKHPSLSLEKVEGAGGVSGDIWAVRVSRSIRMTFERDGDRAILRNVGPHDETLGRP